MPAAAGDRDARPLGQAVLRMRCIILDPSAVKVFKSQHKYWNLCVPAHPLLFLPVVEVRWNGKQGNK